MTTWILALDQGTTSSRAILFDAEGNLAGVAQREFEQIFPSPGLVEHDANAIWRTQIDVANEVLAAHGVTTLAGVGITNQRETTVVWDRRTGEPVCNAIVWQDRRTAPRCAQLVADGHADLVRARTGLVLDAYFSATKVEWILDNVDGARAWAEAGELAFGTIDAWLIWKLTEGRVHATEPSNASRTMLFDIHRGVWDDDLLALFRVPRSMLPEVRGSSEVLGDVSTTDATWTAPIAGVAGDQQAALFGQTCFERGMAKNTYGTGCFMLLNTGDAAQTSAHQMLTTVAWGAGGDLHYALEGSVFVGGAVVQWLRDGLGLIESSSDVEALAASVPDTGDTYLVPALTGLGAPYWDPRARGTIVGLSRGTTAAHIARAALEGIAHQVADVLDAMSRDADVEIAELRVDGGAAANDLLMQFQADLLGVPIERPSITETTALGAAYLAGLAVGVWPDRDALAKQWSIDRRFEPVMSSDEATARRRRWRMAVERAREWAPE